MSHLRNFGILLLSMSSGAIGFLVLKGLYRDFSLLDFSLGMFLLPFLAGIIFLTGGLYIGYFAFKRMKGS